MTARTPAVDIIGIGIVAPVGLSAQAAAAAIRADICRVRESEIQNKQFEQQRLGLIPDEYLVPLVADIAGTKGLTNIHKRLLRLGGPALAEAAQALNQPAPLFLGLREPEPKSDPISPTFLAELVVQSGVRVLEAESKIFRLGGAAGLFALREALGYLAGRKNGVALVGAIDSFLDMARLARLDAENRLKGYVSTDGFIPGEAAAFVALSKGMARQAIARVRSVGTGLERGHRHSEKPYRGDGLADAFRDCFGQAGGNLPLVRTVYAGFNGENMPGKEWGVALLRSKDRFAEEFDFEHPAESIGDAGAALGLVSLICACCGFQRQYRESPALIWSTSDREHRAAAPHRSSLGSQGVGHVRVREPACISHAGSCGQRIVFPDVCKTPPWTAPCPSPIQASAGLQMPPMARPPSSFRAKCRWQRTRDTRCRSATRPGPKAGSQEQQHQGRVRVHDVQFRLEASTAGTCAGLATPCFTTRRTAWAESVQHPLRPPWKSVNP